MKSEITRFREQQALEEQAAFIGFTGYAMTSRHAFIEKRMEQGAVYLTALMEAGKYKEAFALMNTEDWQGVPLDTLPEEPEEPERRSQ